MEGSIDFGSVKEVAEKRMTKPGTIDVFEITKVEFGESSEKKTAYMRVSFDRQDDNFRHDFFLSEKALPRVKTLLKYALGEAPTAAMSYNILTSSLMGKKLALKVTAKVNESNGKVYADLPFGGFGKAPQELTFLSFSKEEQDAVNTALISMENSRNSQPDNESATNTSSPEEGGRRRF